MNRLLSRGLLAATLVTLAACGSDSDNSLTVVDPPTPPAVAQLQVVHASADAPDVNVLVNGAVPAGLAGVPFAAASPYLELEAGTIDAAVNAILPDGSEVEVLAAPGLALDADIAYTVIAAGSTADLLAAAGANPLNLFLLTRPVAEAIDGVRIQVLHGSPSAPEVDVYVSAPDAELATVTPATFAFGEVLDLGTVPAAEYRIRITPTGSEAVVFDSGAVALPDGADLSIVAVDNVGPGSAPVALLAVFADGTVVELRDGGAAAPAGLTAVHNSADAPAVCVVADDAGTAEVERVELFPGVPFRGFGYLGEVPPGSYLVGLEVFDAQTGCAGTSAVTFDTPVDFAAGAEATGIVVGSLGGGTLELLPLADDLRPIATEARVRIVHGSEATPAVDIYVVPAGTDITAPDVTPDFSAVEFTSSTGFVALPPGEYDVFVTLAGDTTPAIAVEGALLEGGDVISAIASDPAGEETAPGLIVIDHLELKNPPL
ncbi:DUF4397 domain-containing protein [Thioalkalivibrio sp. XN279]|uniref:DUF4397 domain-containing protein n=1 Tax=Thioalkalivibrio sp. XN279 TaxID=2714953 RepID=UPI001407E5FD|nr:DUF4397 domain-containing protein [Thioalkalivibrio sp. XN279]NHA14248.1 DUF4397 domain-containing protein [Thioalkalivibrio sp. XN279]